MAGDWIKMGHDLPEKPEVVAICHAIGMDVYAVVGRLHRLWSWFDRHTINGNATGVTFPFLNSLVCHDGFVEAMVSVGWMCIENGVISVTNFDRHNSKSAKERALGSERLKRFRNGASVTKALPEKRREEKNISITNVMDNNAAGAASSTSPSDALFDEFWKAYPKRVAKGAARKAFKAASKRVDANRIVCAARELSESPKGRGDVAFIQNPATWLNADGWDDDRAVWNRGDDRKAKPTYEADPNLFRFVGGEQ